MITLILVTALSSCVVCSTPSSLATTSEEAYDMDDFIVVEATIRNRQARPITVERSTHNVPCYTGERETDVGWERAIAPIVPDGYIAPIQLSPGEVVDVVIRISASSIIGPQRGTYRLVFDTRYASSSEPLAKDLRISNTFRIE